MRAQDVSDGAMTAGQPDSQWRPDGWVHHPSVGFRECPRHATRTAVALSGGWPARLWPEEMGAKRKGLARNTPFG